MLYCVHEDSGVVSPLHAHSDLFYHLHYVKVKNNFVKSAFFAGAKSPGFFISSVSCYVYLFMYAKLCICFYVYYIA